MLYRILRYGGPRDGEESYSPRPYERARDSEGHVYAARESGDACIEWAGDDERIIRLYYRGIGTEETWLTM